MRTIIFLALIIGVNQVSARAMDKKIIHRLTYDDQIITLLKTETDCVANGIKTKLNLKNCQEFFSKLEVAWKNTKANSYAQLAPHHPRWVWERESESVEIRQVLRTPKRACESEGKCLGVRGSTGADSLYASSTLEEWAKMMGL